MTHSNSFQARALFTWTPDRIYRVEVRNGCLYFLRVGGQFDLDRGGMTAGAVAPLPALLCLAANEALFRKHKQEELIARDPNQDPEQLLAIHPHNFKLSPSDIRQVTFLPKKWLLSFVRPHFGRLVIEQINGKSQEYHFERQEDVQIAMEQLPILLREKVETRIRWDGCKQAFVRIA